MKFVNLTCPNCGAIPDMKEKMLFCPYCGAKLIIDDESVNINYTYTKKDEAKIRENERKERIRLKELEYKEREKKRDIKIGLLGLWIPLGIIVVILLGLGINKGIASLRGHISAGDVDDYIGQNYKAVVEQFEEMGFKNIVTVDLKDSGITFWKDETVKSISINGDSDFGSLSYFDPDEKVIITYH